MSHKNHQLCVCGSLEDKMMKLQCKFIDLHKVLVRRENLNWKISKLNTKQISILPLYFEI